MLGHCKCTQMFPDAAADDAAQVDFDLVVRLSHIYFHHPCTQ